jgi:hypothetical protein
LNGYEVALLVERHSFKCLSVHLGLLLGRVNNKFRTFTVHGFSSSQATCYSLGFQKSLLATPEMLHMQVLTVFDSNIFFRTINHNQKGLSVLHCHESSKHFLQYLYPQRVIEIHQQDCLEFVQRAFGIRPKSP